MIPNDKVFACDRLETNSCLGIQPFISHSSQSFNSTITYISCHCKCQVNDMLSRIGQLLLNGSEQISGILYLYLPQGRGAAIDEFIKSQDSVVLPLVVSFSISVLFSGLTIIFERLGSASFANVVRSG